MVKSRDVQGLANIGGSVQVIFLLLDQGKLGTLLIAFLRQVRVRRMLSHSVYSATSPLPDREVEEVVRD